MKPYEFSGLNTLIFGDVHQNIAWAAEILRREAGNYDAVVFLGDAFDSFLEPPKVAGARQTAEFFRKLLFQDNFIWLCGNHDLPYLESSYTYNKGYTIRHIKNHCSGFTKSKANEINKEITPSLWQKLRVFCVVNGWLLSHAGIREKYFRPILTLEDNLAKMHEDFREELTLACFRESYLNEAGFARGGLHEYGSPLWCDFDCEFEDNLPLKQIVGHTSGKDIRKIGRCFCIDCHQSTYAIISKDGEPKFKRIIKDERGNWNEVDATIISSDNLVEARKQTVNINLLDAKISKNFTF